jgi:hypothetical protein
VADPDIVADGATVVFAPLEKLGVFLGVEAVLDATVG